MSTVVEIDDVAGKGTARTADVSAAIPLTVIQPPSGWQMINLRELWQFRELIYFLAWRDVKVPLQADGAGSGLGHPAAADDDGGL